MSDQPTLYRWRDAEPGGPWVDTPEMRRELIDDGVLVPVKPVGTLAINHLPSGTISLHFEPNPDEMPPGEYLIVKANDEQ